MDIEEIAKSIGLILSGSAVAAILNFFIKNKEVNIKEDEAKSTINNADKESDLRAFEILKDTWYNEFKRNEAKFEKLFRDYSRIEAKMESLEQENTDLKLQLTILKTYHPEMPIPIWLKDQNGIMLSLNQAYEDAFLFPQGKTRVDYIGMRDEDIWPDDIAHTFRENDLIATAQRSFVEIKEDDLPHPLLKGWRFYKYPVFSQGTFIGIAGLSLPK